MSQFSQFPWRLGLQAGDFTVGSTPGRAMYTGFYRSGQHIHGSEGYTRYFIEGDFIYGPNGNTKYYVSNGHVFGPKGYTHYFFSDNHLCGPSKNVPWIPRVSSSRSGARITGHLQGTGGAIAER